eukprot:Hpha_TRINITY_DN19361_c0_g1::TRINITY_DN19361_c0_g1_i1::g.81248::m.81248/K12375/ARSI_J; arylsulfatase I/J
MRRLLPLVLATTAAAADKPPHILFVVGDDVGYGDIGALNDHKTQTPTLNGLLEDGVMLTDYYTFKICSPSRAAMITGRYPWAAGFYDMSQDTNHCTTNSTALPELLKPLGYATHALGKWDVGYMQKRCSATMRGFDTFFGYYDACQADYWYHGASGGYPARPNCTRPDSLLPTDFSNSSGADIRPASDSLNGTYNTRLLADEAARLVSVHDVSKPFYMYLAFMAVHDGCEPGNAAGHGFAQLGKQAPMGTVDLYNRTVLDTYKVAGAMYTELDSGIKKVIHAMKARSMWENTVFVFVSDNGGPLDHCTNAPLRGGKHTFFEGGVRVLGLVSGPLIPTARRGARWSGMAASADWYKTIVEGMAGGVVPAVTGTRPADALNLWPAILGGDAGPRTEVVHQVQNEYICDVTQGGGGCCSSMRMGEMKLIIGGPGDSRTVQLPKWSSEAVPFGLTGGSLEPGTDHARAGSTGKPVHELTCKPWCLFNLTSDIAEQHDLGQDPSYQDIAKKIAARLAYHGSTGPLPAYIWPEAEWQQKVDEECQAAVKSGYIEPLDA